MENRKLELEKMVVEELRNICRKLGLTLQRNGKKFTKSQLIENILAAEAEHEVHEKMPEMPEELEVVETAEAKEVKATPTLKDIVEKYGHRKKDHVYEKCLRVGSPICFVYKVITPDGKEIDKLRTAKVFAINRKAELVRVQTLFGSLFELSFDDLLYIRESDETNSKHRGFPKDIREFLKQQRGTRGEELIIDKFKEQSVVANS